MNGVLVTPFFFSTEEKPFDRTKFWDVRLCPVCCFPSISDASQISAFFLVKMLTMKAKNKCLTSCPKWTRSSRKWSFVKYLNGRYSAYRLSFHEDSQLEWKGWSYSCHIPQHYWRKYSYGLVTQQTKPTYKYFLNGRTLEEAKSKTVYYDAVSYFSV